MAEERLALAPAEGKEQRNKESNLGHGIRIEVGCFSLDPVVVSESGWVEVGEIVGVGKGTDGRRFSTLMTITEALDEGRQD